MAANLSGELGRLEENQREIRATIERAMEVMLDAAQHEKAHQRRVLEIHERALELMEQAQEKRKPWYLRWFGG